MRHILFAGSLTAGLVLAGPLIAQSPAELAAIFKAAGFVQRGGAWKSGNCDGFESTAYSPFSIETYRDLNDDGRPEAVAMEGGAICYGHTETHYWLLSKQANGSWMRLMDRLGKPEFLATKGVGGWPDILNGGPGFCFPVLRWNGREYRLHRFEDDGRACKRP